MVMIAFDMYFSDVWTSGHVGSDDASHFNFFTRKKGSDEDRGWAFYKVDGTSYRSYRCPEEAYLDIGRMWWTEDDYAAARGVVKGTWAKEIGFIEQDTTVADRIIDLVNKHKLWTYFPEMKYGAYDSEKESYEEIKTKEEEEGGE